MGYDYSLGFLGKHHETVQKLVKIAKSGEILVYESTEWEKIRQRHQLIRSVLANVSHNMPEYKDIRTRVRTWTEHMEGGFRLCVGVPNHQLTGRAPAPASLDWRDKYMSTADIRPTGVYLYPLGKITVLEDLQSFVGAIPGVADNFHTIEAQFNQPGEDEVAYLDDLIKSIGWTVASVSGETILMKRVT